MAKQQYIAELPHELFIRYLLQSTQDYDELLGILREYELAEPTTAYLKKINSKDDKLKIKIKDTDLAQVYFLLQHKEREFIDALCLLYNNNERAICRELKEYCVEVDDKVMELYIMLFWNSAAVQNRKKWKRFLNCLPEDDEIDNLTGYRNLLRLARMGEDEILFFKLNKRKPLKDRRALLEDSLHLAYIKFKELMYKRNDLDNSRMAVNWGNLIASYNKELSNLDDQYTTIMDQLQEGIAELEAGDTEKNKLDFSDIMRENESVDKAEIIQLPKQAK